ncbi:hypothetical protein P153DRAFT_361848 [Dothidotthia symphoricarpi CBS 119687]|uniref:Uncharacterized protein n=1 Tax=Dothidotthia symphoricarpi CBS 119687 TaxID=1392245 RepID=A0A6A5ZX60_9PLEO|nr:uncharacterized protein P153DRAFT_361848 [Dothidotthia symphoricarpi CBS 119687]KAF2123605.1 hypothetical protein P153DRAFT_361848 [Dothidotthia symphoricarpi CBS 119687]
MPEELTKYSNTIKPGEEVRSSDTATSLFASLHANPTSPVLTNLLLAAAVESLTFEDILLSLLRRDDFELRILTAVVAKGVVALETLLTQLKGNECIRLNIKETAIVYQQRDDFDEGIPEVARVVTASDLVLGEWLSCSSCCSLDWEKLVNDNVVVGASISTVMVGLDDDGRCR